MMETGYPNGTATLICLRDGTTSLYTSSGGGVIGGHAHAAVVRANEAFLDALAQHTDDLPPDPGMSLPVAGRVVIRAMTYDGPRVYEAAQDDLGHGRSPLSPVFHAGHAVLTELRLISE